MAIIRCFLVFLSNLSHFLEKKCDKCDLPIKPFIQRVFAIFLIR